MRAPSPVPGSQLAGQCIHGASVVVCIIELETRNSLQVSTVCCPRVATHLQPKYQQSLILPSCPSHLLVHLTLTREVPRTCSGRPMCGVCVYVLSLSFRRSHEKASPRPPAYLQPSVGHSKRGPTAGKGDWPVMGPAHHITDSPFVSQRSGSVGL